MSREIKFRAFIGGEMINSDNLAFEEYGLLQDQLSSCGTLMQYTGLKDENGIDVFEGDVIEGDLFDSRLPIIGAVEYDDYFAHYSIRNNAGLTPIRKVDKRVVGGNIYEYPELLERKP